MTPADRDYLRKRTEAASEAVAVPKEWVLTLLKCVDEVGRLRQFAAVATREVNAIDAVRKEQLRELDDLRARLREYENERAVGAKAVTVLCDDRDDLRARLAEHEARRCDTCAHHGPAKDKNPNFAWCYRDARHNSNDFYCSDFKPEKDPS